MLSKHPITAATCLDYPAYSKTEALLAGKKRGLVCEIDMGDRQYRVAAVHLSHRDEAIRNRSALLLDQLARDDTACELILAGDFNSTPLGFPGFATDSGGENAMETIAAGKRFKRFPNDSPDQAEMTFSSDNPTRVIDWIMIPKHWKFEHYGVVSSELSDHRLVVTDVTIIDAPRK